MHIYTVGAKGQFREDGDGTRKGVDRRQVKQLNHHYHPNIKTIT